MIGRMTHVCHLITALGLGGAEQTVYNLVQNDENTCFTVCCLEAGGELISPLSDTDADVFVCGERFRFDPIAILDLCRYLSDKEVDVLHTHLPYAQVVGRFVASIAGIDVVVSTQHSIQSHYHPVTRWLEQQTSGFDTATVAVSEGVKQSFVRNRGSTHDRNWSIVHNGIDVSGFNSSVADSNPKIEDIDEKTVFLNVGRCVPAKNQRSILTAMNRILESIDDAHLVIAGSGPLHDELAE
ncbi:glycosyltransferase [Halosimplex aquaticum]